jgi:signal transduction histidine kinase
MMNKVRLEQILVNAIQNAIDATETDDQSSGRRVAIRMYAERQWVNFTIENTGSIVCDGVLEHAFDAFFTTKPSGKGTGLGLFISRRLAEEAGGQVSLSGLPQGGAVFQVRLPLCASDEE